MTEKMEEKSEIIAQHAISPSGESADGGSGGEDLPDGAAEAAQILNSELKILREEGPEPVNETMQQKQVTDEKKGFEELEKRLSKIEREMEAKAIDKVKEKIGKMAGVNDPDELIREFAQDNREDEEFLKFAAGTPERFVKSVVNHYKLKRGSDSPSIPQSKVPRSTLVNDLLRYIE